MKGNQEMRKKITITNSQNLTIKQAHELFIRKCTVQNLSEKTLKVYNNHFGIFSLTVNVDDPINTITSATVDDFVLYLRSNNKCNEITINSYLWSIRAFLYYCMEENYIPSFKIKMIKAEKKIKETYSDAELERLLRKPDIKSCSFTTYKTWVFENYLLGTGNRLSTALNVKVKDIDFYNHTITLAKTKNRRQQIIPLSRSLAEILTAYLEIRGNEPDNYVFCNQYGEQGNARTYQDLVAKYNHQRGVVKKSIHLFRHTFAKQWILSGGDIFRLQKILGHSDLSVTKEYVQMFGADLQMDFERFNPLDNLRANEKKEKITMKK